MEELFTDRSSNDIKNKWNLAKRKGITGCTTKHHSKEPDKEVSDLEKMDVIHRMISFLYEQDDVKETFLGQFLQVITDTCTMRHLKGKSKNLPGAIFEIFVCAVGGSDFLRVYQNSKHFIPTTVENTCIGARPSKRPKPNVDVCDLTIDEAEKEQFHGAKLNGCRWCTDIV
jgi:hypothetical protein